MKTIGVIEARARLSALVAQAEKGEPTLVTRRGREAAMIVPIEIGRRLFPKPSEQLSFAGLLTSLPPRRERPSKAKPAP